MLPKNKLTAVVVVALAILSVGVPTAAEADDLASTEISYRNGEISLHGTVVTPPRSSSPQPGRRAAVVIVAGAGITDREYYRPEAEAFARAGIVTLIYDKRAGYSRATSSFGDLASDAIAGVRALRARSDVDPERIGLWGHSQGGWVVPLAASKSSDVKFIVTVAGSGLKTDRTQLWSNRIYLEHAGVQSRLVGPIGLNLSRMMVAAGLFGDTSNDPVANLEQVDQPVLAVWGAYDRSLPPGESLNLYRRALDRGGNTQYSLRVIPRADHSLKSSPDGYRGGDRFAPGYLETVTSWINGSRARLVDRPPAQPLQSRAVEPLAWYEAPWLHAVAVGLMVLAFLTYPVGAVVRRLRGRREQPPARWAARSCAVAGIGTVLGTIVYLFSLVVTGATSVGTTVLGRPLPWLFLQLAAAGVVVAGILMLAGWARGGRTGTLRIGALTVGAAVFVPWALYWGLFTA